MRYYGRTCTGTCVSYSHEIFVIFARPIPTSSKSPDFSPSSPHSERFDVSRYKTKKVFGDLPDVGVPPKPRIVGLATPTVVLIVSQPPGRNFHFDAAPSTVLETTSTAKCTHCSPGAGRARIFILPEGQSGEVAENSQKASAGSPTLAG